MIFNRIVLLLACVTVLMQGLILYRQAGVSRQADNRTMKPPALQDVPKNLVIDIGGHPVEGDGAARIGLVEFSDYECPYCRRHTESVGVELKKRFVVTGMIRHVFVNNPLPIHRNAKLLAA